MSCYELYDKKTICPVCRSSVGELFDNAEVVPVVENTTPSVVFREENPQWSSRDYLWLTVSFMSVVLVILLVLLFSK